MSIKISIVFFIFNIKNPPPPISNVAAPPKKNLKLKNMNTWSSTYNLIFPNPNCSFLQLFQTKALIFWSCPFYIKHNLTNMLFALFQYWLQLLVFHLEGDSLSNFVLILIILNLLLWVFYYTVQLWNAHLWVTLGCSFTCYQRKFNLLKSSLWIC